MCVLVSARVCACMQELSIAGELLQTWQGSLLIGTPSERLSAGVTLEAPPTQDRPTRPPSSQEGVRVI